MSLSKIILSLYFWVIIVDNHSQDDLQLLPHSSGGLQQVFFTTFSISGSLSQRISFISSG